MQEKVTDFASKWLPWSCCLQPHQSPLVWPWRPPARPTRAAWPLETARQDAPEPGRAGRAVAAREVSHEGRHRSSPTRPSVLFLKTSRAGSRRWRRHLGCGGGQGRGTFFRPESRAKAGQTFGLARRCGSCLNLWPPTLDFPHTWAGTWPTAGTSLQEQASRPRSHLRGGCVCELLTTAPN